MFTLEFKRSNNMFARIIELKLFSKLSSAEPSYPKTSRGSRTKADGSDVVRQKSTLRCWAKATSMIVMSFGLACLMSCALTPPALTEPHGADGLQITSNSLPVGALHQSYAASVSIAGGFPPYTWTLLNGELPPGLSLNASSGAIGGDPSEAGSFSFRTQITDAHADSVTGGLSINISTELLPAISTISPSSGTSQGGTRVTIHGSNFQTGASVRFGALPATVLSIDSGEEIQVTTPAAPAGSVSVAVQNPDGGVGNDANSFVFDAAVKSSGPGLPAAPQTFIDTSYPDTTGYTVTSVAPGSLQTALQNASCSPNGTILELPAGSVDNQSITLPNKTCASGQWIIVTTAGVTLPPQGTRLDPSAFAGQIARITDSVSGGSTIQTQPNSGVNHYRLVGLEIEQTAPIVYMVVDIGANASSADQLPSNIIIDRCYVHGKASNNVQRDILLNGSNLAVVDSYISEGHWVGADAQAVGSWNGSGPLKITNNFLEGSGENILIGGAVALSNLIPSDIEVRSNYFYKPVAWRTTDPSYAGIPWTVKNLFELKNAQRVIVDGNVMEYNWTMAQTGTAILFTPRAEYGNMPWDVVQDVTFTHNIVRHAAGAFNMLGIDNNDKTTINVVRLHRVLVRDNLLLDISKANWVGFGALFQFSSAPDSITIDHNTGFSDDFIGAASGNPLINFFFTNNIVQHGQVGFIGSGTAEGNGTLARYAPSAVFLSNAMVGANPKLYPPGNVFPASIPAVQFVNFGGMNASDYALCTGKLVPAPSCASAGPVSAGQASACQNNTNCGADISALGAATAGVAVLPASVVSINSLSPNAMVCNGINSLVIDGSNLSLQGVEVMVNGKLVSPSMVSAQSLTITPPAAVGITVPVVVDDFGLPVTKSLVCQ